MSSHNSHRLSLASWPVCRRHQGRGVDAPSRGKVRRLQAYSSLLAWSRRVDAPSRGTRRRLQACSSVQSRVVASCGQSVKGKSLQLSWLESSLQEANREKQIQGLHDHVLSQGRRNTCKTQQRTEKKNLRHVATVRCTARRGKKTRNGRQSERHAWTSWPARDLCKLPRASGHVKSHAPREAITH